MSVPAEHFERLYQQGRDPYGLLSDYERRRFTRIRAALAPFAPFGHLLEIGCGEGALSEWLAPLCARLTALDASATAVTRARASLGPHPHAQVEQAVVPDDLAGSAEWDAVVLAEVGYYLHPHDLAITLDHLVVRTPPGAIVLGCHWRHPGDIFRQTGDDVHNTIGRHPQLRHHAGDVDDDMRLDLWRRV